MNVDTSAALVGQSVLSQKPVSLSYADAARRANGFASNVIVASESLSDVTRASSDCDVLDSGTSDGEWECHFHLIGSDAEEPAPSPLPQPRAQLSSKASLFVPGQKPAAVLVPVVPVAVYQQTQQPPEDQVEGVIRQVFGPHLKGFTTTEDEYSTALHLELDRDPTSSAPEQAVRSHAVKCLTVALDGTLGPKLKDMRPSTDGTELTFEFFAQGTNRLCWKFANGCCHRGRDCYWEHAIAQLFVITVALLPPPQSPEAVEDYTIKVVRDEQGKAGYRLKSQSMRIAGVDPLRQDLNSLKVGHLIKAVNSIPVENIEEYQKHAVGAEEFTITVGEEEFPPCTPAAQSPVVAESDFDMTKARQDEQQDVAAVEERVASKETASVHSYSSSTTGTSSPCSPAQNWLASPSGKIRWADLEDDEDDWL